MDGNGDGNGNWNHGTDFGSSSKSFGSLDF